MGSCNERDRSEDFEWDGRRFHRSLSYTKVKTFRKRRRVSLFFPFQLFNLSNKTTKERKNWFHCVYVAQHLLLPPPNEWRWKEETTFFLFFFFKLFSNNKSLNLTEIIEGNKLEYFKFGPFVGNAVDARQWCRDRWFKS